VTDAPVLADLTTLRVGGPAARVVVADDEAALVAAVRDADADGTPALVVAGGSNLLVADSGYPGTVVLVRTSGVAVEADTCGGAWVTVAAGEDWDAFVARTVAEEWAGLEALSGIPGSVGATPIQNVGAYGQEVGHVVARVRTWDRLERTRRTFAAGDCGFGYRTSRFKAEPGRYLVLEVSLQLRLSPTSEPIRYAELARSLGIEVGQRAPLAEVRDAVLALRRGKGMVLDGVDHDTWSAGSFFTNPVLDPPSAAQLPVDAPRFDVGGGRVKTSAAWLIEHAGFVRGHGRGPATLSTKHVLALTNRGGASAADILDLAREVRAGVAATFGVVLVPEPVLVGCSLDPT
jgi:UDP-N-acetylmuramate dehydrogenase